MALNGLACFVGTTLASSLLASWHRNADFMDAVSNTQDHMRGQKLHKIVITGGPCSGKTTAMERLQVFLRERGYRVFVCPEAATILLLNGASFDDFKNPSCPLAFQQFVIRTQMTFEDNMAHYARIMNQPTVILCDRGLMDGSAYIDVDGWSQLMAEVGLDPISARDSRYDAVFHLVTAADGAEAFYTLENNKARSESLEAAIEVDKKTQAAWSGHPHHIIVDNRRGRSFESKLEYLVASIAGFVGLPSTGRQSHKFPLLEAPDIQLLPNVQVFDVEKIMLVGTNDAPSMDRLTSPGYSIASQSLHPPRSQSPEHVGARELYRFIRKRSQNGFSSYGLTTVMKLQSGENMELKEVISSKMYRVLAATAVDKSRQIVKQRRYCFLWEMQSFHIYEYITPQRGLWVLLCQSEGSPVLPPFLRTGPECCEGDEALSSYALSKK